MTSLAPTTPSFVFGYWRPWNEGANAFTSYLDYTKDVSLAKYGADTVGQYISQASKEHVQALDKVGRSLDLSLSKLSSIDGKLGFLNQNMGLVIEQQRLSNLLLGNIAELLRVPDSEKERQHTIELGIKFFVNGSKDPDLYADALEMLLKAEAMMKQDYFVLHRIGCIYLHVEKHLDPTKALDYFTRAAKYASVDSDPKAARLANALTVGGNAPHSEAKDSPEAILSLAAESYEKAAFAAYILGSFEEAVRLQSKALNLSPTARDRFTLSKYQMRYGQKSEALQNLDQAITDAPLLIAAIFREVDLLNEFKVMKVIEPHGDTYRSVCNVIRAEDQIVKHMLGKCVEDLEGRMARLPSIGKEDKRALLSLKRNIEKLRSQLGKPVDKTAQAVEGITHTIWVWTLEEQKRNEHWRFDYEEMRSHCRTLVREINCLANFVRKAGDGPFGENEKSFFEVYGQYVKALKQEGDIDLGLPLDLPLDSTECPDALLLSDALALLAAADRQVSSAEIKAIASILYTFGVVGSDKDHRRGIEQAVAGIRAKGITVFANSVRDRLIPYRGTQFLDDVFKAMADLSERDGSVHENENRVINWLKQQLGDIAS